MADQLDLFFALPGDLPWRDERESMSLPMLSLAKRKGGGFGDARERPSALVEADIAAGLVTREAAARDYGRG